jgi:hypothetical protein
MNAQRTLAFGTAIFLAGLNPAPAQDSAIRTVEQYSCKDMMRESGDNRNVAIAFLNGFLLGKSGSSTFDIDALHKRTTNFIEYCLDHPNEQAEQALAKLMK